MGIEFAPEQDYGHEQEQEQPETRSREMIELADERHQFNTGEGGPRITVVGVGGGGSNAVDAMGDGTLEDVEFIVVNTDVQALQRAKTTRRIHIGQNVTKGLGTGANPLLGEQAANEDRELIRQELQNADLVFITAGLGGGTGTGASTVIADVVKEIGALSVAITTKPFDFEGTVRHNHAEKGQQMLRKKVDTLITVPNQRLINVVDENTTLIDAFTVSDNVLKQCVQSIADLITRPGLINLDFADIKAIMDSSGGTVMGVGYGQGEKRAEEAFKQASSSPLMEEQVIEGAKGILINITSGSDVKLKEIHDAVTHHICDKADADANVIFGVVIDPEMKNEMKVTILATGTSNSQRNDIKKRQEEERTTTKDRKQSLKAPLPYVAKKGLNEVFEGEEEEEIEDYGFADQPASEPASVGSTNSYSSTKHSPQRSMGHHRSSVGNKQSSDNGNKKGLPPLSKSIFQNLKNK